jgi:hypothetical protein
VYLRGVDTVMANQGMLKGSSFKQGSQTVCVKQCVGVVGGGGGGGPGGARSWGLGVGNRACAGGVWI